MRIKYFLAKNDGTKRAVANVTEIINLSFAYRDGKPYIWFHTTSRKNFISTEPYAESENSFNLTLDTLLSRGYLDLTMGSKAYAFTRDRNA